MCKGLKIVLLVFACICISFTAFGQENLSRLAVKTSILEKHKLKLNTLIGWKHLYNHPNWKRVDISGNLSYELKQWRLLSGLNNYLVFDDEIDNYFEIRPWIGIRLKTPITNKIELEQTSKGELRNLMYIEGGSQNKSYWRSRYEIKLFFKLFENEENQTHWFSSIYAEVYFNQDRFLAERFASSKEYSIEFGYQFPNRNQLFFKYIYEKTIDDFESSDDNSNTFALIFSF